MANKTIGQLTDAAIPILATDKMIISRDGQALTKSNVGDLPLKTVNGQALIGTGNIAVNGTTNLGNTPAASTVDVTSSSGTGTTIPAATTSAAGVMTASDKVTLANKYDQQFPAIIGGTTVRGIGNRSSWPNQSTSGQLLSGTVVRNISKTVNRTKLLFVGASQYTEILLTSPATFQGVINYPIGSDNWYNVTFDNGSINGQIPSTGQYRIYESDWVNFNWPKDAEAMLYLSSVGGNMPTMGSNRGIGEWSINGQIYREFQIQSNATQPVAGQLEFLNKAQLRALSSSKPQARIVSSVTYNGTAADFRIYSHGVSSLTNLKLLIEDFVTTGVNVNGLWTGSLAAGSHDLRVTMGDPGTVTQNGVIRIVSSPTAITYDSGTGLVTVTRATHGQLPGNTVCLRGVTTTTSSLNYDQVITAVTTDTFSFPVTFDPGTITITNAYYYSKYVTGTAYHLRPVAFLGESDVECTGLVSDSTSSTVDFITDPTTMLQGVAERCVGEVIPFINISATNDGLYNWFVSNATKHEQRQEVLRRYTQTLTFGFQKNDENNYNTSNVSGWITNYESFWNIADFAAHKATGKNKLILTVTRNTSTRDAWSTRDGQILSNTTGTVALGIFQKRAIADLGSIYNKIFDLNIAYCEPGMPGIYKTNPKAREIIVTTVTGSSVVDVSATTPITMDDNGEVIGLVGAESTGSTRSYGLIKYVSPTKFFLMGAGSARNFAVSAGTNSLTNGRGIIGANYSVQQSTSTTDVVHESTTILQNITNTIALKRDRLNS